MVRMGDCGSPDPSSIPGPGPIYTTFYRFPWFQKVDQKEGIRRPSQFASAEALYPLVKVKK